MGATRAPYSKDVPTTTCRPAPDSTLLTCTLKLGLELLVLARSQQRNSPAPKKSLRDFLLMAAGRGRGDRAPTTPHTSQGPLTLTEAEQCHCWTPRTSLPCPCGEQRAGRFSHEEPAMDWASRAVGCGAGRGDPPAPTNSFRHRRTKQSGF